MRFEMCGEIRWCNRQFLITHREAAFLEYKYILEEKQAQYTRFFSSMDTVVSADAITYQVY